MPSTRVSSRRPTAFSLRSTLTLTPTTTTPLSVLTPCRLLLSPQDLRLGSTTPTMAPAKP
ncbi:hypothetical protein AHAS_Ahas03G0384500 [Arachis hypogaea]